MFRVLGFNSHNYSVTEQSPRLTQYFYLEYIVVYNFL